MEDNKNAYSEVIEILKLVDEEKKLEALPMEMLELLKSKANPEYKPKISKDIPLDEQNLQPETYALLNWITQKYWNDEQEQEQDEQIDREVSAKLPVLLDNLKWYEKIKIRIIELFSKIFKRNKSEDKQEGII